ncbi:MAG: hypothetical protein IIX11_08485 [Selenomonadales bacterium]|nr:hypothetical protein [Selenomonadales bacterium]
MMWTIVSPELWNGEVATETTAEEVISYQGVSVAVSREGLGEYRVKRILSTDPKDFLSSEIYPDAILKR